MTDTNKGPPGEGGPDDRLEYIPGKGHRVRLRYGKGLRGRFIIALDDKALTVEDRRLFEAVLGILRDARRSDDVTLLQRSIILLEGAKRPAKTAQGNGRPKARA